jgi:hypothetical protein
MSDETHDRTLLPELLPRPSAAAPATPRERVVNHAKLILERFRGLKTTAGAALLGLQCSGYGVVDPLPPPAHECKELSDPLDQIEVTGSFAVDAPPDAPRPIIVIFRSRDYPKHFGYRLGDIRVTGGRVTKVVETTVVNSWPGSEFEVTIAPEATPSILLVEVDIGCGAVTGTKRYRITARPASAVVVEELRGTADGGVDR